MTPKAFKNLSLIMRFKQNYVGRNLSIAHLLSSVFSIPLLLVLGAFSYGYHYLDKKSEKNRLIHILKVSLKVVTISLFLITGLSRILLFPVMIVPAFFINWGTAFIQALRGKQTLSAVNCDRIAGGMNDTTLNKERWQSLVNICTHPITCLKMMRLNKRDPKNLAYINSLLPAEMAAQKTQLEHEIQDRLVAAPETHLTSELTKSVYDLINMTDAFGNRVVFKDEDFQFYLKTSVKSICTKDLRGVSTETMNAAVDKKTPTLNAADTFILLFNAQLRLSFFYKTTDSLCLGFSEKLFESALRNTIKDCRLYGIVISPAIREKLFLSCIVMKTPSATNMAQNLINAGILDAWGQSAMSSETIDAQHFLLHYVALYGNLAIAQLLVDKKLSLTTQDKTGKIPFDYIQEGPHAEKLRALLSPPASVVEKIDEDVPRMNAGLSSITPPPALVMTPHPVTPVPPVLARSRSSSLGSNIV